MTDQIHQDDENESDVFAFIGEMGLMSDILTALQGAIGDHLGLSPEEIDGAAVAKVRKARLALAEIAAFLDVKV